MMRQMMMRKTFMSICLLLACNWAISFGADFVDPYKSKPLLSPKEALEALVPRPGFKVEQVAAEPLVMDPVDIAFGPDGKLWVVEMADYPLGMDDKGKHGGRVRYLEDTDGDGRYDKSTLFLENLGFPNGVMPWRKGVLITCAPEIFYAEDTDGDGKADVRRPLYAGFGECNQQHRVNHLRFGLDNWVYVANGDGGVGTSGMIKSTKTGQAVEYRGRDLRLRPDEGSIDVVTGQAQFGRVRDDWGNWCGCNNNDPGWLYAINDYYIRRNPHLPAPVGKVSVSTGRTAYPAGQVIASRTIDQVLPPPCQPGRFTSLGGITVYRDELFGPTFNGNLLTSDSVFGVVHRLVLRPDGVLIRGDRAPDEQQSEFLASKDPWFRPATLRTGPDGALYVVDMYRTVIEHPQWIYGGMDKLIDLRGGHEKGRIYRVFPKNTKPRTVPRLDRLDTAGLVGALDSPNGWQRDMAQRMLIWRADTSAVGPLEKMVADNTRALARLHALCTLDGLKALKAATVLTALSDRHPGVRRHAIRLSEPLLASTPALGEALLKMADDLDPQVRMQLAYSLGEWNDPRAGRLLGQLAVRHANDPYLTAAVMSSAVGHLEQVIAEVLPDASKARERAQSVSKLISLAMALKKRHVVANELGKITARPNSGYANWQYEVMAQLLDGLDQQGMSLEGFADGTEPGIRKALEQVSGLFAAARELAGNEKAPLAGRTAAVRILGRGLAKQDEDLERLVDLLVPQTPIELQLAVVDSLGRLRREEVPKLLVEGWSGQGPRVHNAVIDTLISRQQWVGNLLDLLEARPSVAAKLDAKRRDILLRYPDKPTKKRAEKVLGAVVGGAAEIQKTLAKYKPVLKMTGDPVRGKELYVEATCADCHKLGDVGTEIGPDLRTLVDRSPEAILIANIDPNRAMEDKYGEYTAVTADGKTLAGMLMEETSNSITLADTAGKLHVVLRKNLEELVSNERSHMPEGLEGKLDLQQMADVIAFVIKETKPAAEPVAPAPKQLAVHKSELVRPEDDGSYRLLARKSEIHGRKIRFNQELNILAWYKDAPDDHVSWLVEVPKAGKFDVYLEWAQIDDYAGNPFAVEVEGSSSRITGNLPSTGGWNSYRREKFGTLQLGAGKQRVVLRPNGPMKAELSDLREICLAPVGSTQPAEKKAPAKKPTQPKVKVVKPAADGSLSLHSKLGRGVGPTIKYIPKQNAFGYWTAKDHAVWLVDVPKPGKYEMWLIWALPDKYAGSPFALVAGSKSVTGVIPSSGGWTTWGKKKYGTIELKAGRQEIVLRPNGPMKFELCDMREVLLVPVAPAK